MAILFGLAIVMGFYLAELRRREALVPTQPAEAQHVTPPVEGAADTVTVWVAHDDTGTLRNQSVVIPSSLGRQQRATEIMRALLNIYQSNNSPHRLAAGAEIRQVYLVDPGLAVIDLNAAFADGQTSGVLAEELTIASMIQSLSSNVRGITQVKFLVDGNERDTLAGHADLTGTYAVSQISDLAKQLSEQ
jgi:hypothetical protein